MSNDAASFSHCRVQEIGANGDLMGYTRYDEQRRHQRAAADAGNAYGQAYTGACEYVEQKLHDAHFALETLQAPSYELMTGKYRHLSLFWKRIFPYIFIIKRLVLKQPGLFCPSCRHLEGI